MELENKILNTKNIIFIGIINSIEEYYSINNSYPVIEEITVSELADSCNMSETYFRKLFSRVFGMSPQNYMTHKKISYACDLLLNTRLSVEEVSYESGYRDPAYFCRIFRKTVGCSPGAYRKQSAE